MKKTVKTLVPAALMAVASTAQAGPLSNMLHELSINPTLLAQYKQNPTKVIQQFELSSTELSLIKQSSSFAFDKAYAAIEHSAQIQTHHDYE